MYYVLYSVEGIKTKIVEEQERDDLIQTKEWFNSIAEAEAEFKRVTEKFAKPEEKKGGKRGNSKNTDS